MPKAPKDDCNETEVPPDSEDAEVWSEDHASGQYYYDDAYGYEVYREREEEEEDEDPN